MYEVRARVLRLAAQPPLLAIARKPRLDIHNFSRRVHRTSLGLTEDPMAATSERNDAVVAGDAQPLPKLTAAEFKEYNRMAEHMEYFVGYRSYYTLSALTVDSTITSGTHGT